MASTANPPCCFTAKYPGDLDLADAFDDKNDRKDGGRPDIRPGEGTSTSPLHPACHTVPWDLRQILAVPHPLLGTGSQCQTPFLVGDGARRSRGAPLPAAPACRQHPCPARAGSAAPSSGTEGREGPW